MTTLSCGRRGDAGDHVHAGDRDVERDANGANAVIGCGDDTGDRGAMIRGPLQRIDDLAAHDDLKTRVVIPSEVVMRVLEAVVVYAYMDTNSRE